MSLAAVGSLTVTPALADDEDKAACANLEEDDDCTRGDGDPGTCIPDESDGDVLTCDDDASGSGASGAGGSGGDDSGGGCSAAGGDPIGALAGVALLGLALLKRRRG